MAPNRQEKNPQFKTAKGDILCRGVLRLRSLWGKALIVGKAHSFGGIIHTQKKPNSEGKRHRTGKEKRPLPASVLHDKAQPRPRKKITAQRRRRNQHRRDISFMWGIPNCYRLTGKGDFRHYAPEKTARLQAYVRAFFARSQIKLCVFSKRKWLNLPFFIVYYKGGTAFSGFVKTASDLSLLQTAKARKRLCEKRSVVFQKPSSIG